MPLYQELVRRMVRADSARMRASREIRRLQGYGDACRFYNPKLAGGAMLDIGVYALSISALLFKPAENVSLKIAARPAWIKRAAS